MNGLISVIVPVYNVEKYIRQCLDSIINQTYKNLEIILVDDGSTDNSGQICDEYAVKDNRIKVIHKENGGQSSARNTGLDVCTSGGDFVAFVDSDDWLESDMYETLYRDMRRTKADIVVCGYYVEYLKYTAIKNNEENFFDSNEIVLENCFYNKNFQNAVWCKLYNRNIFNKIRFPEGRIYEDMLILLEILEQSSSVLITDKILYHYRQQNNSTMNMRTYEKSFEKITACQEILLKIQKKHSNLLNLAYSQLYRHYLYLLDDILLERIVVHKGGFDIKDIKKYFRKNILEILNNPVINFKKKIMYMSVAISPKIYNSMRKNKDVDDQ